MEPPSQARLAAQRTMLYFFGGSSSYQDADVMKLSFSSSSWTSNNQKSKRNKVVPNEIVDVDEEDDSDIMFFGGNTSDYKNKQPMKFGKGFDIQLKDDISNVDSGKNHMFDNVAFPPLNTPNSSKPVSVDFNFAVGYDYDDYEDDYYEESEVDSDFGVDDYNYGLSAKFDGLGLPPGVEASVSGLQQPASEKPTMTQPPGVEASVPWLQQPASEKPTRTQPKTVVDDVIDLKLKAFKQFDTINGDYDHYYAKSEDVKGIKAVKKGDNDYYYVKSENVKRTKAVKKPPKDWTKRIQHEWKVMEKDLPDMIYVRVSEDRMEFLRAVIIGPAGTPYHDGLFFFDAYFPPGYPYCPPMIHYHSGGLRLNPNLYACGKVCLSLLGTWSGSGCEKWNPSESTLPQVLVSIQALVLNAKPYFNEPSHAHSMNTPHGEKRSLRYNEETFLLSCRTMLYSLRRPPKHFEDFVAGHFRERGKAILVACRAYLNGAQVGCLAGGEVQGVDEGDESCSQGFGKSLRVLFDELLKELAVKGVDCDEFLTQTSEMEVPTLPLSCGIELGKHG